MAVMYRKLPLLFRNRTLQIAGVSLPSFYYSSSMSSQNINALPAAIIPYIPRHKTFPYTEKDFSRHDRTSDNDFYAAARIVHHIDDAARRSLAQYYDSALPQQGRILDFCSSWVSHYPPRIEQAVAHDKIVVVGMGMNQAELSRNPILSKTILQDLNMDPTIPSGVCGGGAEHELLDASTCVVSIDYLIHPVEVLSSLRERTRLGGIVHLVVSNRCFPTKAVARWLQIDEQERLSMVGDYLYFAGWRDIEVVDVKASHNEGRAGRDQKQGGLGGFMASFGLGHEDPLWVVRGKRTE